MQLELQRGAGVVPRVELQRHQPGLCGPVDLAGRFMHLAHAEPAERPLRRELERAEHQFGGRRMVAGRKQHLGIVVAPVGEQVAG